MEIGTDIIIDPEFEALITPLSELERDGLERDLLRDGCREPLVIWHQENGNAVVLDGHNRLRICKKHKLRYSTVALDLPSRETAMIWICENQMHRRNLNETQRGMIGDQIATLRQSARTDLSPIGGMSQAQAAKVMNVGERTIQRAGVVRELGSPKLIGASRSGVIPVSLGEVIAKLTHEEQDRIAAECLKRGDSQPARAAVLELKNAKMRMRAVDGPGTDSQGHFALVFADLWRCEPQRSVGGRDIINHRCLVAPDKIRKIGKELAGQLLPYAVLFLRAPGQRIGDALGVVKNLGFECPAHMICMNPSAGLDEYVRYEHDVILIGPRAVNSSPIGTPPRFGD